MPNNNNVVDGSLLVSSQIDPITGVAVAEGF
jgi:hypothetical protein